MIGSNNKSKELNDADNNNNNNSNSKNVLHIENIVFQKSLQFPAALLSSSPSSDNQIKDFK